MGVASLPFDFGSRKKSQWMSLYSNSVSGESNGELEGTQKEQMNYLGCAKREVALMTNPPDECVERARSDRSSRNCIPGPCAPGIAAVIEGPTTGFNSAPSPSLYSHLAPTASLVDPAGPSVQPLLP